MSFRTVEIQACHTIISPPTLQSINHLQFTLYIQYYDQVQVLNREEAPDITLKVSLLGPAGNSSCFTHQSQLSC